MRATKVISLSKRLSLFSSPVNALLILLIDSFDSMIVVQCKTSANRATASAFEVISLSKRLSLLSSPENALLILLIDSFDSMIVAQSTTSVRARDQGDQLV